MGHVILKGREGIKSASVAHLNHTLSGEEAQRTLQLFVADNPEDSNTQHATDRGGSLREETGGAVRALSANSLL